MYKFLNQARLIAYKNDYSSCNFEDCSNGKMVKGSFEVIENNITKSYCKNCTFEKYPKFIMMANKLYYQFNARQSKINEVLADIDIKTYELQGIYLRRVFNRTNHYKILKNTPLINILTLLGAGGYKVPLFAKNTQIAITSKHSYNEDDVDRIHNLIVKLEFWQSKGKHGYNIVCL